MLNKQSHTYENEIPCTQLLRELFEKTSANEISNHLSESLDTFITNTKLSKLDAANASNLVIQLIRFFYEAEKVGKVVKKEIEFQS